MMDSLARLREVMEIWIH